MTLPGGRAPSAPAPRRAAGAISVTSGTGGAAPESPREGLTCGRGSAFGARIAAVVVVAAALALALASNRIGFGGSAGRADVTVVQETGAIAVAEEVAATHAGDTQLRAAGAAPSVHPPRAAPGSQTQEHELPAPSPELEAPPGSGSGDLDALVDGVWDGDESSHADSTAGDSANLRGASAAADAGASHGAGAAVESENTGETSTGDADGSETSSASSGASAIGQASSDDGMEAGEELGDVAHESAEAQSAANSGASDAGVHSASGSGSGAGEHSEGDSEAHTASGEAPEGTAGEPATAALPCPSGWSRCDSAGVCSDTECAPCEPGYYQPMDGYVGAQCTKCVHECPAGTYRSGCLGGAAADYVCSTCAQRGWGEGIPGTWVTVPAADGGVAPLPEWRFATDECPGVRLPSLRDAMDSLADVVQGRSSVGRDSAARVLDGPAADSAASATSAADEGGSGDGALVVDATPATAAAATAAAAKDAEEPTPAAPVSVPEPPPRLTLFVLGDSVSRLLAWRIYHEWNPQDHSTFKDVKQQCDKMHSVGVDGRAQSRGESCAYGGNGIDTRMMWLQWLDKPPLQYSHLYSSNAGMQSVDGCTGLWANGGPAAGMADCLRAFFGIEGDTAAQQARSRELERAVLVVRAGLNYVLFGSHLYVTSNSLGTWMQDWEDRLVADTRSFVGILKRVFPGTIVWWAMTPVDDGLGEIQCGPPLSVMNANVTRANELMLPVLRQAGVRLLAYPAQIAQAWLHKKSAADADGAVVQGGFLDCIHPDDPVMSTMGAVLCSVAAG